MVLAMNRAMKRMGLLSRAIVALLAVAFALAPFHVHESNHQTGKSAIVLTDSGHDHTDSAPDKPMSDCAACIVMKQIEHTAILGRSDLIQVMEIVIYPVTSAGRPRRLIAEHFRPPWNTRA